MNRNDLDSGSVRLNLSSPLRPQYPPRPRITLAPYGYIAPALIGLLCVIAWPMAYGLLLSFYRGDAIFHPPRWTGLGNYLYLLGDPLFHYSFGITLLFTVLAVTGTIFLGTAVGLFLNRPFPGRSLVAIAVLLPWAMPRVAGTTVWKWIFDDQAGLLNDGLVRWFGLTQYDKFAWLAHPETALMAAVIVVIWQSFPFVAFSVLAALQGVGTDLLHAASIDGANAWQRIRHIQLPLIRPVLVVLTLLSVIWDLKVFDQIFVLTGGGPSHATAVLGIYLWEKRIEDIGLASAMAMILVIVTAVFSVLYARRALGEE